MEVTKTQDAELKNNGYEETQGTQGKNGCPHENLNKEIVSMKKNIKTIKKNQSQKKTSISEMKNTLVGINNSLDEAEDQTSDLEDEITEKLNQGRKKKK